MPEIDLLKNYPKTKRNLKKLLLKELMRFEKLQDYLKVF